MKTRLVRYPGGDAFQVRDDRGRIGTALRIGSWWFWSRETGRASDICVDLHSGRYYAPRDAAAAIVEATKQANSGQMRLRGVAA